MASTSSWLRRSSEEAAKMKSGYSTSLKAQDSPSIFARRSSSRIHPLPPVDSEPAVRGTSIGENSEHGSESSPERRDSSAPQEQMQKPTLHSKASHDTLDSIQCHPGELLTTEPSRGAALPGNTDLASWNLQTPLRRSSNGMPDRSSSSLSVLELEQAKLSTNDHKRAAEEDDSFGSGLKSLLRIMSLYIRPATAALSGSVPSAASVVPAASSSHALLAAAPTRFSNVAIGQPASLSLAPLRSPANAPQAPPSLVLGSAGDKLGYSVLPMSGRSMTLHSDGSLHATENDASLAASAVPRSASTTAVKGVASLPLTPLPRGRSPDNCPQDANSSSLKATPAKSCLSPLPDQYSSKSKSQAEGSPSARPAVPSPRPPPHPSSYMPNSPMHGGERNSRVRYGQKGLWSSWWEPDTATDEEDEALDLPLLPPLVDSEDNQVSVGARASMWQLSLSMKKTLVLDLDETLVHSMFSPPERHSPDYIIDVPVEGRVMPVYVLKRPGVHEFLEAMAQVYEVVVFTASMSRYADPLLDKLDPSGRLIKHRLFREACSPVAAQVNGQVVQQHGGYVKDLSRLGRELSATILVDNSPHSFAWQPANGLLVPSFIEDMNDDVLFKLIPFLTRVATAEGDVRLLLKGAWGGGCMRLGGEGRGTAVGGVQAGGLVAGAGVRRDSGGGRRRPRLGGVKPVAQS